VGDGVRDGVGDGGGGDGDEVEMRWWKKRKERGITDLKKVVQPGKFVRKPLKNGS
jgi:hypothetical protein